MECRRRRLRVAGRGHFMIDMRNARRVGNWTSHVRGPRIGIENGELPARQSSNPSSEELSTLQAATKSPEIKWSIEFGKSGFLVGTVSRRYDGCQVMMSVRVDPHRPYRIVVARKALAERLSTPAALLAAVESRWKEAIDAIDQRDLRIGRMLADMGFSCYLTAGNCLGCHHARCRQEIIIMTCTSVPENGFSFRLELGKRSCFYICGAAGDIRCRTGRSSRD